MKLIKTLFFGMLFLGVIFAVYKVLPKQHRYAIDDVYYSFVAPKFIESPDYFSPRDQDDLIREYKNRNYKLDCYGSLQKEERIGKEDDYLCNAYMSSAFDNIPARRVTFFFAGKKLSHVRMEFPEKSHAKLQDYLGRKLADFPRLDQKPGFKFGTDNFGKPLMVWAVREGLLTTATESTQGETQLLLWSALRPEILIPLQSLGR